MNSKKKQLYPKSSLPRGQKDISGDELRITNLIISKISAVYESYGFEGLSTPAFEFSESLGKFLPDDDRPNSGVFSFLDDDDQWLSLRYDLTSPLARYVAENNDQLPKPFRRYQTGSVWRNEKPGPGRFREFIQMDVDNIGPDNPIADAEMVMIASDCVENLGIPTKNYDIRVSNRKILDAIIEVINNDNNDDISAERQLIILRAIDKLDRIGYEGVEKLLGSGRKDESGDFTKGAELESLQIKRIIDFTQSGESSRSATLSNLNKLVYGSSIGEQGIEELSAINSFLNDTGYGDEKIIFDPSVVRGLGYYTGPIFEANLSFDNNSDSNISNFGSIGGGGRYDDLVARFNGNTMPATGFSIGVSRLYTTLKSMNYNLEDKNYGPVIILSMDKEAQANYHKMAKELRDIGIKTEVYTGNSGLKAQMKYADRRNSPLVIIEGTIEREEGTLTIKDLIEGKKLSNSVQDRETWTEKRPAQEVIKRSSLIDKVCNIMQRYGYKENDKKY
jgi:histidyl-tRNA synthetase